MQGNKVNIVHPSVKSASQTLDIHVGLRRHLLSSGPLPLYILHSEIRPPLQKGRKCRNVRNEKVDVHYS